MYLIVMQLTIFTVRATAAGLQHLAMAVGRRPGPERTSRVLADSGQVLLSEYRPCNMLETE